MKFLCKKLHLKIIYLRLLLYQKNDEYFIRWFTPYCEADLCGHATLASAYIYFNYINKNSNKFIINSKSGYLTVTKNDDVFSMNFPADSIHEVSNDLPEIDNFWAKTRYCL